MFKLAEVGHKTQTGSFEIAQQTEEFQQLHPNSLSIVIPVRNEAKHIERTLEQLVGQTLRTSCFEILVIDGESDDETPALVRAFAERNRQLRIRFFENPLRLSSGARNIGARAALGKFVLIIDGHVEIPSSTLLEDCLRATLKVGARCLGRPQPLDPTHNTKFQNLVCHARQSPLAHSTESMIFGGETCWVSPMSVGVMYDRTLFTEVGYFDESFDAAEDLEFNYRLEKYGIRCLFSPKFQVRYYPRESLRALFFQVRRYGRGRAKFLCKHPERFRMEVLLPSTVLLFLLLFIPFMTMGGVFASLAMLGAVLYGSILIVDTLRRHKRNLGAKALLWVPMMIVTVHCGMGYGFISGMFEAIKGKGQGWSRLEGDESEDYSDPIAED